MNKGLSMKPLLLIMVLILALTSTGTAYAVSVHTLPPTQLSAPKGWMVLTQAGFQAGVLNNVTVSSSLGEVRLNTTTTTLGNSANNQGALTYASDVYVQNNSYAIVPYNGTIISWTYYSAGATSTGARLEFLSGSGTTWTMRAKSDAVTINGTNTFTVSIPVQAGWYLAMYTGSANLYYDSSSGTVSRRADGSGDFAVGVTQSDFSQAPYTRHLALTAVLRYYYSSGTIASKVFDTGKAGARWDWLGSNSTIPSGTSITFQVRASDYPFSTTNTTLAWQNASALPIYGRYQQWRAILTTSDTSVTPVLREVRVLYY
jgi:hypothetical protein